MYSATATSTSETFFQPPAGRITIPDADAASRAPDLVKRDFDPPAPDRLWVADFTYCPTWSGTVYVAFVIDAYARRMAGTTMRTGLVLDAVEMSIWARGRQGAGDLNGLVHHSDAGSQYTSIAFTERLVASGVDPSVGNVGDAYDNSLAETTIGLFKTEVIKRGGPWRTRDQVEYAVAEWVDWYNHRRLHSYCGDIPPAELEAHHYSQNRSLIRAGNSTT